MKIAAILITLGILFGAPSIVSADNGYFLSPSDRIMCTIRAQNLDGSHDAVGTDLTNARTIIMEIIKVTAEGIARQSWDIDRVTGVVSLGGYAVFREHCSSIMKNTSPELRKLFEQVF